VYSILLEGSRRPRNFCDFEDKSQQQTPFIVSVKNNNLAVLNLSEHAGTCSIKNTNSDSENLCADWWCKFLRLPNRALLLGLKDKVMETEMFEYMCWGEATIERERIWIAIERT
jgi:hypothetical protein